MNLEKLLIILNAWRQAEIDQMAVESAQSAGSHYLRERLQVIAERCCRDYGGDLVEIGCLNGSTSVLLAEVAKEHGRRLICVDPWEVGTQNCHGGEYETFLDTTRAFARSIDMLRLDSRLPEAVEYLKGRVLCFAFVDGLHTHAACLSDIRACYHSPLVVCDDWTWSSEIQRAIVEATGNRKRVMMKPFHEAYLL